MKILTSWLRTYLPTLPVDLDDRQLAEALTLRGIAVEGVHPLAEGRGHLFEMDITTNRVDAMNHFGVAREAATIWNLDLFPLTPKLPTPTPATPFHVRIDPAAQHLCGRFTARVLRSVTIAPSTGRVVEFFTDLGQKLISNAVDASNFTLLGMGHPTHAFDLDKIHGGVVVRLAHPGEKLRLLDGTERTLEPDDLVIADETRALSLAGVMGGLDSSITPQTRNILVESAWFDPATIRRSSRRHGLHTDASHRFERGADFNAAPLANDLVASLILASGDGHLVGDLIDLVIPEAEARTAGRATVALAVAEVRRHLGTTLEDTAEASALTPELIEQYLHSLGCHVTPLLDDPALRHATHHAGHEGATLPEANFEVALPSWRLDLERPIDLIEEVARVFGYNRFANTLPRPRPVTQHPSNAPARAIRSRLLALGYTEAISTTFASQADSDLFAPATDEAAHVRMENPLSDEARNLRPSLLPGMLSMLALNLNRDVPEARLFEAGEVFRASASASNTGDQADIATVEDLRSLALGLTSASARPTPLHSAADAPIFELKGVLEGIVSLFAPAGGPHALSFTTTGTPAWLEPGRGGIALLHNQPFATFGELAETEAARRKLRQPVYLASVDLEPLFAEPLRRVTAHEISRFQAADRDFSFLFPDAMPWRTIAEAIHALALPDLQRLLPVEIFRDPKGRSVPPAHYSLLLRTIFQSETRTLREEDLAAAHVRIIEALTALGGTHRA